VTEKEPNKSGFPLDTKGTITLVGCFTLVCGALALNQWIESRFDAQDAKVAEAKEAMSLEIKEAMSEAKSQNANILLELKAVSTQLKAIEQKAGYRFSSLDMKEWAIELREMNPELGVPDVEVRP